MSKNRKKEILYFYFNGTSMFSQALSSDLLLRGGFCAGSDSRTVSTVQVSKVLLRVSGRRHG